MQFVVTFVQKLQNSVQPINTLTPLPNDGNYYVLLLDTAADMGELSLVNLNGANCRF